MPRRSDDRWAHRPDIWSGLVLGSALATRTFRPSLMPRRTQHQAIVSGASGAIGFGVANATYGLFARTGSTGGDLAVLGVVTAGGFALSRALPEADHEAEWKPIARTVGSALAGGGVAASVGVAVRGLESPRKELAGAAVTGVAALTGLRSVISGIKAQRAAHDEYDPPPPKPLPALGQAAGVASVLTLVATGFRRTPRLLASVLSKRIGVPATPARWIGRGATIPIWFMAGKAVGDAFVSGLRVYDRVVDAGFDRAPENPFVSSGEGSPIPFARLGREGRRFVLNRPGVDEIERVMGRPAVAEPIRVFVGYAAADTDEERIDLAIDELRRTGAFDRRLLVVGCPAGNGFTNTLPLEVLDYVLAGDTAAVAVQYGRLPSFLTFNRVTRGGRVHRELLTRIRDELADRPADRRPRVVIYGESLGAWSGQDAFIHEGLDGLDDAGVSRALWVGAPWYAAWRHEVLVDRTLPAPAGTVVQVDGPGPLAALTPAERDRLRAVILVHGNDPVAYLEAGVLVRRPPWLGPPPRPWGVPDEMQFLPGITAIQVIVDAINATRPVPGVFRATGHEYTADLPDATLLAYGIDHPEADVWARLVDHLQAVDAERASHSRRAGRSDVGEAVEMSEVMGVDAAATAFGSTSIPT